VGIGQPCRTSDGVVFSRTQFCEKLIRKELQVSNETPLPGTEIKTPHIIIASNVFCFSGNIMKSYPGLFS
jgi:hypothetical protein